MMEKTYEGDFDALPAWAQKKIESLEAELDLYSRPRAGAEPNTFIDPYRFHEYGRRRQGRPVGVGTPVRLYLDNDYVEVRVNRDRMSVHVEGSQSLTYIPTSPYETDIELNRRDDS